MTVFVADERGDAGDAAAPAAVDLDRLRSLAEFVAADRGVPADMDLAVLCVTRSAMAELNRVHMGAEGPTDVLAFPIDLPGETLPGAPAVLGDVVLCPEVAGEQARAAGHDAAAAGHDAAAAELDMLLVHGILHLLGHDHADAGEGDAMFRLTDRLLSDWRDGAGDGS